METTTKPAGDEKEPRAGADPSQTPSRGNLSYHCHLRLCRGRRGASVSEPWGWQETCVSCLASGADPLQFALPETEGSEGAPCTARGRGDKSREWRSVKQLAFRWGAEARQPTKRQKQKTRDTKKERETHEKQAIWQGKFYN